MATWKPTDATPLTPLRVPFQTLADSVDAEIAAAMGSLEIRTHKVDTLAALDAIPGRTEGDIATVLDQPDGESVFRYTGTVWRPITAPRVGVFGADGNSTIGFARLIRSSEGVTSLQAQVARTNGTTYENALILGVLPVGFRPSDDAIGVAATYGSGTAAFVIAESATGIVRLTAPSPAGHTAARVNLSFPH